MSKKKIKKTVAKRAKCEFCGKSYTRVSSLTRHKKTCVKTKINEINQENRVKEIERELEFQRKLHEKEKEMLQNQIKQEANEKKIYKAQAGYFQEIFHSSCGVNKMTVSSYRLLSEVLKNPPAVQGGRLDDIIAIYEKTKNKMIKDVDNEDEDVDVVDVVDVDNIDSITDVTDSQNDDVQETDDKLIKKKDDDFIEDIFQQHSDGTLYKYIGDMIVKLYKKDNEKDQSIFNSDTSRLTYIISKVLYKDGETKWHIDKGGVNTKGIIIKPILEELRPLIVEYHHRKCVRQEETDDWRRLRIEEKSLTIIKNIDNEVLHDKILKYMAKCFYLDTSKKTILKKTSLKG